MKRHQIHNTGQLMLHNLNMISATAARLLFFGGRYVSMLLIARLLGVDSAGFLLSLAVVELLRILFDYGLENSLLARFHQQPGESGISFRRGKLAVRLSATVVGQLVTTGVIAILCQRNGTSMGLPLIASLQFSCLMGFGYIQAHLQAGRPGGMAALMPPLALAVAVQAALLMLARNDYIPLWLCAITFEAMALVASSFIGFRFRAQENKPEVSPGTHTSDIDSVAWKTVLGRIAPLGNVALIGIAYNRLDALAVSWVAGGALFAQYLIYQRLASAPLMFFSTIASVSISTLSDDRHSPEKLPKKIIRFRQLAYGAGTISGVVLASASPLIASFFSLTTVNHQLLGLQCMVMALQIANGFHAALLIALGKLPHLWRIARNNAVMAVLLLPLSAWKWGTVGVALSLCVVEIFCAAQHAWLFYRTTSSQEHSHAR
ncbi:MAG: hypothetical protein WBD81_13720 [Collimonas pratensis]|uniref:lipopolysaccharide biosynthesis protein n=1 Tax=Collimonas pratensis TaxID=279113 RepID=UPI003C722AF6